MRNSSGNHVTDFDGNNFVNSSEQFYNCRDRRHDSRLLVTSVTPLNNSTNLGSEHSCHLTFSKPLNPSTVNNQTFNLFNGNVSAG